MWFIDYPWMGAGVGAFVLVALYGMQLYWFDQDQQRKWHSLYLAYGPQLHSGQTAQSGQPGQNQNPLPPPPAPVLTAAALLRAYAITFVALYVVIAVGGSSLSATIGGGLGTMDPTEEVLQNVLLGDPDF